VCFFAEQKEVDSNYSFEGTCHKLDLGVQSQGNIPMKFYSPENEISNYKQYALSSFWK
jgi:hypothetical protein